MFLSYVSNICVLIFLFFLFSVVGRRQTEKNIRGETCYDSFGMQKSDKRQQCVNIIFYRSNQCQGHVYAKTTNISTLCRIKNRRITR